MEPQFKKYLILLIILAVVALAAGSGIFVYYNGWSALGINKPKAGDSATTPAPSAEPSKLDALSASNQLEFLTTNTVVKFQIPAVGSKTPIIATALPADISDLVGKSKVLSVESVVYSTKATGFEVDFELPQNGDAASSSFLKSVNRNVWKIEAASYLSKAGVLDLQNTPYQIAIEFTQSADQQTQGKMMVIKK